jgi:indole-3-acetate monooxygenase
MNQVFSNPSIAHKSERLGVLSEEWLNEIYDKGYFKLFVPKALGGMGLTLPEALKVEEQLAKWDGSLGWTVTLCAGAGWFVGFLENSLRKEVFSDPKVCLAGSGYVGGKAEKLGDGYLISGSWTYASGALHATHFTANCEIWDGGKPVRDQKGNPLIKAFLLKKEEVEILDGWSYMGMIATGSHAFQTQNLKLPSYRSFEILPEKATLSDPIFQYPFLQFAETTLAVNIYGIAGHLQDLIQEAFWKRNEVRKFTNKEVEYFIKEEKKVRKKMEKAKGEFDLTLADSWDQLLKDERIPKKSLRAVSKSSRNLTQVCREMNARFYPFAGLEAAKNHTELNRVWRDFNTVSQHALLTFPF